jgi:hypothetical protein
MWCYLKACTLECDLLVDQCQVEYFVHLHSWIVEELSTFLLDTVEQCRIYWLSSCGATSSATPSVAHFAAICWLGSVKLIILFIYTVDWLIDTCANRIADDHGDKHWLCANNQRKWGHTCITQNAVLHVVEVSGGGTTSTRAVCRATTKTCTMI